MSNDINEEKNIIHDEEKPYFFEEKRARAVKKRVYEKREFDPNQPHKKPFFDTKKKVWVIPKPRSGMPASGIPASGIPARGGDPIGFKKRWENLYRPPESIDDQNRLADRLLEWAHKDESRHIKLFFVHEGINPYRAFKLAETNPYFSSCLDMAKVLISVRLIDAAQTRKEDGNVNMKLLPMLDQEYSDMQDQKKQMEAARIATLFNITMDKIPDSPLVPKLIKGEKHGE